MKNLRVFSDISVSDKVLDQIYDILTNSECPNESLKTYIGSRYKGISSDGESVYLDFSPNKGNTYHYVYGL